MGISLFGWLDNISWWRNLPYTTKGTILRALKAGLAVTIGTLLTAATAGVLFPTTWSPLLIIVLTGGLQALDKYLREKEAEKELQNSPLTEEIVDKNSFTGEEVTETREFQEATEETVLEGDQPNA